VSVLSAQSIEALCLAGFPDRQMAAKFHPALKVDPDSHRRFMIRPFMLRGVHGRTGMSYGLSHASYDVRLDNEIVGIDPGEIPRMRMENHGCFEMPPRSMVLASTIETFDLPHNILMRVMDKSSLVRRGLTVQNTMADPGWRGFLTLEIENKARKPIFLYPGQPIAQVVFELLDEYTDRPYEGKYMDQERGPQPSRKEAF
jgi:dCTP deaminase